MSLGTVAAASLEVATLAMLRGCTIAGLSAAAVTAGASGVFDFVASSQPIAPIAPARTRAETLNVQASERRRDAKPIPCAPLELEDVRGCGGSMVTTVSFGSVGGALGDRRSDFISRGGAVSASGNPCCVAIWTGAGGRFGASAEDSTSRTNSASISPALMCWAPGARGPRPTPSGLFSATRTLAEAPLARRRRRKKGQPHLPGVRVRAHAIIPSRLRPGGRPAPERR
jgi:hypothetical protein